MRATKGGNQAQADVTSDAALPRILLVGNPNTGKSTLFNLLTGANQKTMNAPRTTVMFEAGKWKLGAQAGTGPASVALVDLPGTYSLLAQSPDEQVTAAAVWPPVDDAAPPAPAHLTS
ncbi:MAG: 50S ribosome-binding GTPase, partial [Bifidobacteriaceae bacterium]|nr:50S ribosome-binding GTPase [Bifidobacteriaceae bacterium]